MKCLVWLTAATITLMAAACNTRGEYVDLNTGEKIEVEKDEETGYMVNKATRKPVYLYVNTADNDTLYGRTGQVVRGDIRKSGDRYMYYGDEEYTYTNNDYVKKMDDDGGYKIKSGDYKKKVDDDGDIKIKTGDQKIKIDKDGTVKVKNDD